MSNKNLQILHISNPFSSLSLLSLLSFFSKSFFLFPALILLFVVPRHFLSTQRVSRLVELVQALLCSILLRNLRENGENCEGDG